MKAEKRPQQQDERPPGRIRGIVRAAKALGVTRQHLRAVLVGRRRSDRLMQRYRALKTDE